jgi:hypothetical protein
MTLRCMNAIVASTPWLRPLHLLVAGVYALVA